MLTEATIRTDLVRAMDDHHGRTCSCCKLYGPKGSRLDKALVIEAHYALDRYEAPPELVDLAVRDAQRAVRDAIIRRAVLGLAPEPPAELVELTDAPETACGAETYDGREHRRCTRPASFTRGDLPLCRQHSRLTGTRAHVPGTE